MSDKLKGAFALFGAAFIYSTFGVLIREMAKAFGNNTQVALRFLIAFLIVGLINLFRKTSYKLPKNALLKVIGLGVSFGCVLSLFTLSVNTTKIANSVFLLYAGSMISSLIIGTILFKEKINITKFAAIAIAIIGLTMYSSAFLTLTVGVLSGLASGLFDGIANSFRKSLKGFDRNVLLQYQFAFGTIFTALLVLFSSEQI